MLRESCWHKNKSEPRIGFKEEREMSDVNEDGAKPSELLRFVLEFDFSCGQRWREMAGGWIGLSGICGVCGKLEKEGELKRIRAEVDPVLEIAEVVQRVVRGKQGGQAGTPIPPEVTGIIV